MRERCVNDRVVNCYTFQAVATRLMTQSIQRAYLIRLWRDHAGAPIRATVISIEQPDKPRHFANPDELVAFLCAQVCVVTLADDRAHRDDDHSTPGDSC
jgi:hypothetical protein